MFEPFTLVVPADARYRELAPQMAAKYAELAGGTAADGQALAAALVDRMRKMTAAAKAGADIELHFRVGHRGVEITARCNGRASVVRQPLPAPKR